MFDPLTRWFVRKLIGQFLLFGWLAVTSPPILWLLWLHDSHDEYARKLSWLALPVGLLWLAGGVWLAMTTAHHMFDDNRLFLAAVRYTLSDLRLKLAFVPIIGGLFMPDEDKTHNDDDDRTKPSG
jgi:hypothetical protein